MIDFLSSIGIIGGADGPTSIFLSGDPTTGVLVTAVLLTAISFGLILHRRKKK